MSTLSTAKEILDTMLGYLGFVVEIEEVESEQGPCLQIHTEEGEALIGRDGERRNDIQYLVNRLIHARDPKASRIRVDVEHYRTMREDDFVEEAKRMAQTVKNTSKPVKLQPMNSYFRRLVHQAFADDPEIRTWSPPDSAHLKRVTLMLRRAPEGGEEAGEGGEEDKT